MTAQVMPGWYTQGVFISVKKKKSGTVDRFLANDSFKRFSKVMDDYKNEVGGG